ncbi:YidC/Oxa1 family membrane protein insertase [Candidatus Falkowbacteria bacterium]|jgi:YidC/Oxa1 family membrane protein insertase|nr:YidC/Oxa1 family membrane protein insertase [Candidatus Falkowbacteria bacterium]MBT4433203.1 YidC/Oxa1 family membrane protein insertase [Candidatus Falkowbacteria bacterium]
MVALFNTVLYEPLFNLLVFLHNIIPGNDVGIAIIILTIIIKLILLPLSLQATKSQKALQDLQPKMQEVKNKYKDNKEEQAKALMELYKKEKVNPLSSCFPLLIQFPFLIAVFQVFRNGFKPESLDLIYPFIERPEMLNPISFGIMDLSKPIIAFAVLAGIAQYYQTKMLMSKKQPVKAKGAKKEDMMAMMNKQMMYMMPVLTVFIGFSLPGGLTFYWFLTTLFMVFQQKIMFRKDNKKTDQLADGQNNEKGKSNK